MVSSLGAKSLDETVPVPNAAAPPAPPASSPSSSSSVSRGSTTAAIGGGASDKSNDLFSPAPPPRMRRNCGNAASPSENLSPTFKRAHAPRPMATPLIIVPAVELRSTKTKSSWFLLDRALLLMVLLLLPVHEAGLRATAAWQRPTSSAATRTWQWSR